MTSSSTLPPNIQSLLNDATSLFHQSFPPTNDGDDERSNLPTYISTAPGRVNLIGEHTDYTGGYVFPLAIGYSTVCYGRGSIVKTSTNQKCRTVSTHDPTTIVEFDALPSANPSETNKWANYVQGVVLQYLGDLKEDEMFVFDMSIAGDLPFGSGLSSSASLEVATAVFLESILKGNGVNVASMTTEKERKMERALRCQRAENVFCNVPCGIMDQCVSSAGCEGKVLLIDCRSLEIREVSMGSANVDAESKPVLVITNSNVKHSLGDGEYPVRVKQCKEATEILSKFNSSVESLRDATLEDITGASANGSLEGILLQRARHVVSENKRTIDTSEALEQGDWARVGRLMNESHASMKDDYEVSCEEIDILVDLAQQFEGVYGSRLTGGGFGGCTVTLVREDRSQQLMDYLKQQYKERTDAECVCFETSPGEGARSINL